MNDSVHRPLIAVMALLTLITACGPSLKFHEAFHPKDKDCHIKVVPLPDSAHVTALAFGLGLVDPFSVDIGDSLEYLGYVDVSASPHSDPRALEPGVKREACKCGGDVIVYLTSHRQSEVVSTDGAPLRSDLKRPDTDTPPRIRSAKGDYIEMDRRDSRHIWLVYGKRSRPSIVD